MAPAASRAASRRRIRISAGVPSAYGSPSLPRQCPPHLLVCRRGTAGGAPARRAHTAVAAAHPPTVALEAVDAPASLVHKACRCERRVGPQLVGLATRQGGRRLPAFAAADAGDAAAADALARMFVRQRGRCRSALPSPPVSSDSRPRLTPATRRDAAAAPAASIFAAASSTSTSSSSSPPPPPEAVATAAVAVALPPPPPPLLAAPPPTAGADSRALRLARDARAHVVGRREAQRRALRGRLRNEGRLQKTKGQGSVATACDGCVHAG